jgi:hypothetical protein
MKNCIITQAKDQGKRLKDWILYYYEQGFDTFIYFDDYSTDNSIDILNKIRKDYNINLIINYTDGIGNKKSSDDMKNSNSYGGDQSVHNRLIRSYNKGLEIVRNINPNANCAIIDVDEFIVSNLDETIVDIIDNMIQEHGHLYIQSFDTSDNFELKDWYTTDINTSIRWDYDSRKYTIYKTRGKSVCKANYVSEIIQGPNYIHVLKDLSLDELNKVFIDDYNKIRIHHLRKPIMDSNIKMVEDNTLLDKMIKIKEKYDKI